MAVTRITSPSTSDTARRRRDDLRKGYPTYDKGVRTPREMDDQMMPGKDRRALRENKAHERKEASVQMGRGGIKRVDDAPTPRKKRNMNNEA